MTRENFREVFWHMYILCTWTLAVSGINHTSYPSLPYWDIPLTCREELNFDVRSRIECASTCTDSQDACQAFGQPSGRESCRLCLGIQCQGVVTVRPRMDAMDFLFIKRDDEFLAEIVQGMTPGPILGWRPTNERRRYFVTTSLIGWAQA